MTDERSRTMMGIVYPSMNNSEVEQPKELKTCEMCGGSFVRAIGSGHRDCPKHREAFPKPPHKVLQFPRRPAFCR
jgi:hypothetical protein